MLGNAPKWDKSWQPPNQRCANSQFITGDFILTPPLGKRAMVVRIAKIADAAGRVVGWAFTTDSNERVGQLSRFARPDDQRLVDVRLKPEERLSGLFVLERNPWSDLNITPCAKSDLVPADKVPWKPNAL